MSARRNLLYMGIYENAQTLSASDPTTLHTSEVPHRLTPMEVAVRRASNFSLRCYGVQVVKYPVATLLPIFSHQYSISTSFVQNVCLFQI